MCELLNLRLAVVYPLERAPLPALARRAGPAPTFETRKIYSTLLRDVLEYRVFPRERLRAGDVVEGPAAIEEAGTTTMLEPGDRGQVEANACLVIDVVKEAEPWCPARCGDRRVVRAALNAPPSACGSP
jgi:N-methylhydantoinase A